VRQLQKPIYRNKPNPDAQNQVAARQMGVGALLHDQFQQRRLVGLFSQAHRVRQGTTWKVGRAIRQMMEIWAADLPPLNAIIEMDEKFFGGKPRHQYGVRHKAGKATKKQSILVTVQRQGDAHPVAMETAKQF